MSIKVMAIFGGRSSEREISIITATEALANMPTIGIKTIPVYIDVSGKWYTGEELSDISFFEKIDLKKLKEVRLFGKSLCAIGAFGKPKRLTNVDVALLLTHGGEGENGTLQGFLEVSGVPYTSSNVFGSALTMDKFLTKGYVKSLGIPVVQGRIISHVASPEELELFEELYNYPMMVKPASQGSSIGITRATDRRRLAEGINLALSLSGAALVERGLRDFAEVNCAAVKIGGKIRISKTEMPIFDGEYLSFGDKYLSGAKAMPSAKRIIPANIAENTNKKVCKFTRRIYEELGLSGVVRMDFLIEGEDVYLNEINSVPGSLAHYLFPEYSYTELLKGIILETLEEGLPEYGLLETDILKNISKISVSK